MIAPVVNPEFCARLTFCLFHSLWVGTVIAVIAIIFTSQSFISPRIRYDSLIIAEFAIFFLLPAAFAYQTFRDSNAPPDAISTLSTAPATATERVAEPLKRSTVHSQPTRPSYQFYVAIVYAAGVAVMLIRVIAGLYGGRRLVRISRPITEIKVLKSISRAVEAMQFTYNPAVAYCNSIVVPCVVNVLRPTLLLPFVVATDLSPQQLEVLVMHELAHIRRHDHVFSLILRFIEAFLFFHPAVWFLSRRIREQRELCCDDLVLNAGREAEHYARSLLRIMEFGAADPLTNVNLFRLAATGEPSNFRHRILRLVDSQTNHRMRLKNGSAIFVTLTAALLFLAPLSFGMLNLQRTKKQPSPLETDLALVDGHLQNGWTPLHYAAAYGTFEQVTTLLAHGVKPDVTDDMGWTPLHFAVALDRREIVRLLLDNHADINRENNQGRTPLHVALGMAPALPQANSVVDETLVKYLLDQGARVNVADRAGTTPLHAAALGHRQASLEDLLKRGAKVDARDNRGRTPLDYAAMLADPKEVTLLLAHGADAKAIDANGWSTLDVLGLQIRSTSTSADRAACAALLLNAGAKPDLSAAVALGMHDLVSNALDENPSLVNVRPSRTIYGNTLLHWAAAVGDADMCTLLLKFGADIASTNTTGQTPLQLAARRPEINLQVVRTLLDAGAPVNAQDKRGLSPLHEAAAGNSVELVQMLVRSGAEINITDHDAATPLHIVSSALVQDDATRVAIARCLLDAKAAINAQDDRGDTPLHLATWEGRAPLVELYLNAGADSALKDNAGRTALAIAQAAQGPSAFIIQQLSAHIGTQSKEQISTFASETAKLGTNSIGAK